MPCCCHVVSQGALECVRNNKCPFCRAPLARNLLDHGLVQGLLNGLVGPADDLPEAGADGAGPSEAAAPGPLEKPIAPGDDEHFRAVVKALSQQKWQAGPEASIALIERALEWKGKRGLRVLLAFRCGYGYGGTSTSTAKLRELLKQSIPSLTAVDFINGAEASADATAAYQQVDDSNRVMCIDTSSSSLSLAGHNFGGTHIVVFERVGGGANNGGDGRDGIKPSTMIQGIGRAMRPQVVPPDQVEPMQLREDYYAWLVGQHKGKRKRDDGDGDDPMFTLEPPRSAFTEKIVVFLDKA